MTDRLMFLAQRETQGVPRDVAEKEWGEVREECARIAASTVRHPVGREDEYVVGTAINAAAAIRAGGKDE